MFTSLLNRNIIIEKETTSNNELGTPVETYSFLKSTKAFMRVLTGGTKYNQSEAEAYTYVEFTIRYDATVNYKCRILYEEQYYKVNHIQEKERRRFQTIRCVVWEK